MAIDREVDMFSQNMKNAPQREVLNVMMREPEGFLANRVENNQREHVRNDVPRAGTRSWDSHWQGAGHVPPKHEKLAHGEMFGTERWENQVDCWSMKLTESKECMYPTIYQKLRCIGGIAIDRELDMFPKYTKNSPVGESLAQNNGRTRWISGQQS